MNKRKIGDVLLVALAAVLWTASSCTMTQKTVAYKTLASIQISVDGGMKAYADLVVMGKIDQPTIDRVKNLHDKYRTAMSAAVKAARYDYDKPAGETVEVLAGQLLAVLVEVTK